MGRLSARDDMLSRKKPLSSSKVSGAERHGLSFSVLVRAYFLEHWRVIKSTSKKLRAAPVDTFMTCAAIAIALALPVGFYLFLNNMQAFGPQWEGHTQISLFLKQDKTEVDGQKLQEKLMLWLEVNSVNLISKEAALAEFQEVSGIKDVVNTLDKNPLPVVLEVLPTQQHKTAENAEKLLNKLQKEAVVDIAQLDLAWVQRLSVMVEIGHRIALGMILFLSAGVLLVVGNTIRLEIESRRAEIEVAQLVGATSAFVRRPFLYTGIAYGFIGGVLAMLILSIALYFLSEPVAELSGLYNKTQPILTLGFSDSLSLLFMAVLLGFVGAWLSVNRHLEKLSSADRC